MFSYWHFPLQRRPDWTWVCLGFLKNTNSHWMLLRARKLTVLLCWDDECDKPTLSIGKECSSLLHIFWLCLCSMYSPCTRGFGSRLSPRLSGVCSYISYSESRWKHGVRQINSLIIRMPLRHKCSPQYCWIHCDRGRTLNTNEWWRSPSQDRHKNQLQEDTNDYEHYVTTVGTTFVIKTKLTGLTFQINVSVFIHRFP